MMNGAFLLSIASFIAKVLSAVYRVPFQNLVGDTGFYVYQQVYPIYGIGMTVALSGLPVFFSKRIASAEANEHRRLIRQSCLILSVFSIGIFGFLYAFAPTIARMMGDGELTPIIQSVSWMFLFSPVLATFRGYFQGNYEMKPTAVSQVSEQLVRVMVILIAAVWYTRNVGVDLYQMGTSAMTGATWGAVVSTVILIAWFSKEKPTAESVKESTQSSLPSLLKGYLTEGVAICLLTSILVLFQLMDSFTLYRELVAGGMLADTAKAIKGVYDRGQPLVQLGMVVSTGFSASFIPLMSRAYLEKRPDEFHRAAQSLIRITASLSVAAVAGLLAILPEVNLMLFGDTEGTDVLAVYILSIVVASIMLALHTILQSLQQYQFTLVSLGIGLVMKYAMNLLLVGTWGTIGASTATVTGLLVMVAAMGRKMPLPLRHVWLKNNFSVKLLGGGVLLYGGAFMLKTLLTTLFFTEMGRVDALIVALLTVVGGVILFLLYIMRVKLFTLREWLSLPFGKKLLRLKSK